MVKNLEQEMGRSHYHHSKCWFAERAQIDDKTNSYNPITLFNTMSSKKCNVWTGVKMLHSLTCKHPYGLPPVNCRKWSLRLHSVKRDAHVSDYRHFQVTFCCQSPISGLCSIVSWIKIKFVSIVAWKRQDWAIKTLTQNYNYAATQ